MPRMTNLPVHRPILLPRVLAVSILVGLVVLFGPAGTAWAVPAEPVPQHDPPGFDPWPAEPYGGSWQTLAEVAAGTAADSVWRQRTTGPERDWPVFMHPELHTPSWILTPALDLGKAPLDDGADTVARLRGLVADYRELLGVDRLDALALHRVSLTPGPSGHSILGVDFKQTYRGYDVWTPTEPVRVRVRADATLGRVSALGSDWITGLACPLEAISTEAAAVRAMKEIPLTMPGRLSVLGVYTYVLVTPGGPEGATRDVRLVHHVRIGSMNPPSAWSVVLDARTGARLRRHDERMDAPTDVIGNVAAGTLDDGPYGAFVVVPMRDLTVEVEGGGRTTTDAAGDFQIAHPGTAQVNITGRFIGTWCQVQSQLGTTFFKQPATPGHPENVVMNPLRGLEFATAEATAYRFVTEMRHFCARRVPRFNSLWGLPTLVNVTNGGSCTAWYVNGSINFVVARNYLGMNCANSAFEEVIGHEYGHAFHVWFHGTANLPRSFSEGIASHLGLYLSGQRIVGRDMQGPGQHSEDYNLPITIPPGARDRQYNDPRCGGSYHCQGQPWVGFTLDFRDLMMAKHGAAQGKEVAEAVTIAPYDRSPASMPQGVTEIFIQDDDDANLQNGTPNFKQLAEAADAHGFPRPPDPPFVDIQHPPLPDTRDTVNPYPVFAMLTSAGGTVNAAWIVVRAGQSAPTSIAFTAQSSGVWTAFLPAAPAVTHVGYWIEARDHLGHRGRWPELGESTFTVGQRKVVFADDFERDRGWTGAHTAWSGRFERVDPIAFTLAQGSISLPVQPEDDHTPGAGTLCYVTQNGLREQSTVPDLYDVDHGYTEIRSPAVDLSAVGAGNARVRFARWFFTFHHREDALETAVSVDNGRKWQTVDTVKGLANQWVVAEVPIPGAYSSATRIRFRTEDDPNDSVTDACIDDVEIVAFDDDVAELRGSTATPAIGSPIAYTLAARQRGGGVFAFAVSLSPGPTVLPGFARLDLGLPFWVFWAGVLDSQGKAAFQIPIPGAPSLRGTTLYTEAMVATRDVIVSNPWTLTLR